MLFMVFVPVPMKSSAATTLKAGWVKNGDSWYYRKDDGFYYKGWLQVGDKYYYMDTDGAMKTGWLQFNNS